MNTGCAAELLHFFCGVLQAQRFEARRFRQQLARGGLEDLVIPRGIRNERRRIRIVRVVGE